MPRLVSSSNDFATPRATRLLLEQEHAVLVGDDEIDEAVEGDLLVVGSTLLAFQATPLHCVPQARNKDMVD